MSRRRYRLEEPNPNPEKRVLTPQAKELLQRAKRIALARKTLPNFIAYVIRDQNGLPVTPAAHQIAWWDHILYSCRINKTAVVLAVMGHGKSVWCVVALPLYLLGMNPNLRIMIVSSGEQTASERLETIQTYIESCQEYREVFPWVVPDKDRGWNSTAFFRQARRHITNVRFVCGRDQRVSLGVWV